MEQCPSAVGGIVHYVSHGTPFRPDGSQAYGSVCRAAVITEEGEDGTMGLVVFNPSGVFLRTLAEGGCPSDESTGEKAAGSWHWPKRG